jgi:hypothetical protein
MFAEYIRNAAARPFFEPISARTLAATWAAVLATVATVGLFVVVML